METEINGIVVIDKPADITSAKVVAIVKKLLRAKKVGHTGTLDPVATGVMICCINQATRLARFFLSGHKVYEAVLRLGIDTDTQDSSGTVTSRCEPIEFSKKKIISFPHKHLSNFNLEKTPSISHQTRNYIYIIEGLLFSPLRSS